MSALLTHYPNKECTPETLNAECAKKAYEEGCGWYNPLCYSTLSPTPDSV
jgi:hypothetical protein